MSGGNPQGVSQGQRDDGGISSAAHLDGSRFALSRFNFGDNYFLPSTDMATGSITSSVDLGGNPMLELKPDARVVLKKVEINGEDVLLYGGDTNNRQIVIYAYDFQTGEFLGSKFLGFSNAYELAGFSTTMDEGLVIAGTTYAAGRFARISLFKLSQKELIDLIN